MYECGNGYTILIWQTISSCNICYLNNFFYHILDQKFFHYAYFDNWLSFSKQFMLFWEIKYFSKYFSIDNMKKIKFLFAIE